MEEMTDLEQDTFNPLVTDEENHETEPLNSLEMTHLPTVYETESSDFSTTIPNGIVFDGSLPLSPMRNRVFSFSSAYSRPDFDDDNETNNVGHQVVRRRQGSISSTAGPLMDEVVENVKNAEVAITTAVIKETRQLEQQVRATLLGHRTFHIAWTSYIVGMAFCGGLIIQQMTGYPFIDCLFHATSALTGAGLQTIGSHDLPTGVFVVSGFLCVFGSSVFMLLPTLIYRCLCLRKFMPTLEIRLKDPNLDSEKRVVLEEYRKIYYGSLVFAAVVVVYILAWYIVGTLTLMGCLYRKPMEPQLADRGFSHFDNALYIVLSGFANAGMTLGTQSLVYIGGNSGAIFAIAAVILAGNLMIPVFLRLSVEIWLYCVRPYEKYLWLAESLQYVLDQPRKITTHLFDRSSTMYLFQAMIAGNLLLFFYFLVSNCYKGTLVKYGSIGHVAGLGLFQIINLRHAGFQVFNMHDLSADMVFISVLAMFYSPMPGIKLLHNSAQDRVKASGTVKLPPLLAVASQVVLKVWFLRFIVLMCIARAEDEYMRLHPDELNLWFIIVELVSAFGLVGVSMGSVHHPTALSGAFTPFSKCLVVLTSFMGKNRAMPALSDQVIHFYFPDLEDALVPSSMSMP